jgi:hypothetical protein
MRFDKLLVDQDPCALASRRDTTGHCNQDLGSAIVTWYRPFNFFVSIWDYGGENKSEGKVDGHDVLLIPHPPNAPPHPTNPMWEAEGGGARGVGRVGWGIGRGGVLEE